MDCTRASCACSPRLAVAATAVAAAAQPATAAHRFRPSPTPPPPSPPPPSPPPVATTALATAALRRPAPVLPPALPRQATLWSGTTQPTAHRPLHRRRPCPVHRRLRCRQESHPHCTATPRHSVPQPSHPPSPPPSPPPPSPPPHAPGLAPLLPPHLPPHRGARGHAGHCGLPRRNRHLLLLLLRPRPAQ